MMLARLMIQAHLYLAHLYLDLYSVVIYQKKQKLDLDKSGHYLSLIFYPWCEVIYKINSV